MAVSMLVVEVLLSSLRLVYEPCWATEKNENKNKIKFLNFQYCTKMTNLDLVLIYVDIFVAQFHCISLTLVNFKEKNKIEKTPPVSHFQI